MADHDPHTTGQNWLALARQTAHIKDLTQLEALVAPLPEGKKGFLTQTSALRDMVGEITKMQIHLDTVSRPILREPLAQALYERIANFRHQIAGFHEPLASEFRQAALQWLDLARAQLQQAQTILAKEPVPSVFRAGDPVNREQEAFVLRDSVIGNLDKQIMLSTGCPGLVLYGRRRVGKSTVLQNLSGFLPDTVIPVVISMQDPQAFTSLADLLRLISAKLQTALSPEAGSHETTDDLTSLLRLLSTCNNRLQASGQRVLLAMDEYENIDRKLGEKIFPEDLLATVR
ncbi:MAG: ATP-binding protein [candidate division KSB1 bacterium]|nr:ATP-binding protein [candidate division KSB1 bacterium]MDZ7304749.1 ATP-binding protein [candidate division KSB1 bacterium]MDZ7314217.1 ATP-binding protein [candidate division KSB1 bacterium]